MKESYKTKLKRLGFNIFPAFRGSGAWITYLAEDMSEIHIRLPLNWRSRNYIGTIFGGSMFSCTDPAYFLMLLSRLGRDYIVWDKSSFIRFKKPGRSTLFAKIALDDEEITFIKAALQTQDKIDRVYTIDLVDKNNIIHASIEKTLHIRNKSQDRP